MIQGRHTAQVDIPFMQTAAYPARPGNAVRPLIDGEPAFSRICEAIEGAHQSVWVTVTFLWKDFQMPGGRGSALDVLNRAAGRGLDVRLICWRPDPETEALKTNAFWGSSEHTDLLAKANSGICVRWDRAHPGFCQHQKLWLIDAGTQAEICFLGGINLNPHSMAAPGHRGEGHQNHDAYMELLGPCAVDVHHNFVQRWNEASERHVADGRWGLGSENDLPWPTAVPYAKGTALVQIQRTIHSGRYQDGRAAPGGVAFDIDAGERSNFDQYCAAITCARHSIYLEHQHISVPEIIDCLRQALERHVEVVAVVPAEAEHPEDFLALRAFERFTMAGLAGMGDDGRRKPVWVHSKLMIIDGAWGTIGSCNLHRHSLFGNAELNAAFWDAGIAHSLLSQLLGEHLDRDVTAMDHLVALRLFRGIATDNGQRFKAGDPAWQGIAFNLLP